MTRYRYHLHVSFPLHSATEAKDSAEIEELTGIKARSIESGTHNMFFTFPTRQERSLAISRLLAITEREFEFSTRTDEDW
jgi:hypothetical protein